MKKLFLIFSLIGFACGFWLIFLTGGEIQKLKPQEQTILFVLAGSILFVLAGIIFLVGFAIIREINKLKQEIKK
jgi:hypothetical protein